MRRSLRAAPLLPAILLFAHCGASPKRMIPSLGPDVPSRWSAGGEDGAVVRDRWWRLFGSATLDSLVTVALERNHDLASSAAALDAAAAEARIAGAEITPALDLSVTSSRAKRNYIGFPIPGGEKGVLSTISTSHGVSLSAAWEIDLWGRIRSAKSAAAADYEAAAADHEAARLSLAAQTAKAYFALTEARLQEELAGRTVESYRLAAGRVRERFERGVRSSLDLRLALSNLAASEALLEQRREIRDRAARQLEILLGDYPRGALPPPCDLPEPAGGVPAGLPASLVGRRPDMVAAERRLAASGARVRRAKRDLLPRISLTASGGRTSDQVEDLLDGNFSVWSLAANLVQPIVQGGRLRANVDLAAARSRASEAAFVSLAFQAFGEVESALAAEEFLARREEALRRFTARAGEARSLASERYRAGLEEFITYLDAERQALSAEGRLLEVRRLRLDNRIDLHLALGGGFAAEPSEREAGRGEREEPGR